jgi:hypothetical protein
MARPDEEGGGVAEGRSMERHRRPSDAAPSSPHVGWAASPYRPARGQLDDVATETKPFFVTSEFFGVLGALAALAVTAASSDSFNAGLLWPLTTGIVTAYVFSRGFAKGGAASRSWDPRDGDARWWGDAGDRSGAHGASARGKRDPVASAERHAEEETREMSTVSREDYGTLPRSQMIGTYGYGRFGMRPAYPIETKPFFLTSEFWGSMVVIVALAIAAGTSEEIDARLFWILATAITVSYVISRGISKSGTKSRSWDPREDLLQGARERVARDDT